MIDHVIQRDGQGSLETCHHIGGRVSHQDHINTGLVYLQIDIYLQDMVAAAVIFFAVLVDAQRMRLISRLERRNIRVEKGDSGPPDIKPAPAPS